MEYAESVFSVKSGTEKQSNCQDDNELEDFDDRQEQRISASQKDIADDDELSEELDFLHNLKPQEPPCLICPAKYKKTTYYIVARTLNFVKKKYNLALQIEDESPSLQIPTHLPLFDCQLAKLLACCRIKEYDQLLPESFACYKEASPGNWEKLKISSQRPWILQKNNTTHLVQSTSPNVFPDLVDLRGTRSCINRYCRNSENVKIVVVTSPDDIIYRFLLLSIDLKEEKTFSGSFQFGIIKEIWLSEERICSIVLVKLHDMQTLAQFPLTTNNHFYATPGNTTLDCVMVKEFDESTYLSCGTLQPSKV